MYSKVTQDKIEKLFKRFCKSVELVSTIDKLRQTFMYKDLIQLFSVQKFSILFVPAVMLVMLVKRTVIPQPGLMNTLVKIKIHIYTNT